VSYESTSSGSGLAAFRFTGAGAILGEFGFVGTDDAPNRAQIENAEAAAAGAKPVIIPVAQTAIAVMVNPPSGCKFKSGKGITSIELAEVFGGGTTTTGIKKWSELSQTEGTCNVAIKRVVRAEGSGTTFQFKNYLQVVKPALPCSTTPSGGSAQTEWKGLEEVEEPNKTWPTCTGGTEILTAAGGGALAEKVVATANSIGYASLPDAQAKSATSVALQNGEVSGEPTFRAPGRASNKTARCDEARYTVPVEARMAGTGKGISNDWSKVFGATPSIGGEEYPLCTLTYDIGWNEYPTSIFAAGLGKDVTDYLRNYVLAAGQTDLVGNWYSKLPSIGGTGGELNVQDAAEFAALSLP
jgi:ABC-type phosphate transport system substrate-binding protein